jgi:hypothetical protein
VQPTTDRGRCAKRGTLGPTRAQSVCCGMARDITDDYPTAKLRTDVDMSDEASPGTVWPKVEVVDRPRRGPHGTQHVALAHGVVLPVMADD